MSNQTMVYDDESVLRVLRKISATMETQVTEWSEAASITKEKSEGAGLRYLTEVGNMSNKLLAQLNSLQASVDDASANIKNYGDEIENHSEDMSGLNI